MNNRKIRTMFSSAILVGSLLTGSVLTGSILTGCGQSAGASPEAAETAAELTAEDAAESDSASTADEDGQAAGASEEIPEYDYTKDYSLIWEDNFDGDSLNRDFWNVELHEPGWVNEEWQEYVDNDETIQVKDGMLNIIPVKKDNGDGTYSYSSGRVTTQNKEDFTYGLFEARLKVPSGKGYLPAFWLMATDENVYGQWPRCGEIDIMEVLGDKLKDVHGTIHYGNPHSQSQGTYSITKIDDFANSFHTFACEWKPGEIVWYCDGLPFHRENKWYSTTEGQGTLTYPAPFDQPFYIILNLAVGGTWVGYPDETTEFEDNPYVVDYVRVFQKDSYDENVTLEEEEVVLREPNADGNYINNGNFSTEESLDDETDWKFLLAQGGEGTATITDNTMVIESQSEGDVDYSVQLVQPNIPMEKGCTYNVSFDASASEDRTFNLAVKAPDRNWSEYMETTAVELTTKTQHYSYDFTMTDSSDPNGRLEYNMGAAGSTGTIVISNVCVSKAGELSDAEKNMKSVLADGNLIYNGKFQEGDAHLGFWNFDGGDVSVTDFADGRRLKLQSETSLSQEYLPLQEGTEYIFSFSAESAQGGEALVDIGGYEFTTELEKGAKDYTVTIPASTRYSTQDFKMTVKSPGEVLLDNLRLVESAMILNGSFNASFVGYEWFCDTSAKASYVIDSLSEDNALDITINDTGSADWNVQVMQKGIKLEKGKSYTLSFDGKSSLDRDVYVLMQGLENLGWPEYSGKEPIRLTSDMGHYQIEFTMEADTDEQAFLSICLGAVEKQLTEQHRVVLDNFELVEVVEN